MAGFSLPAELAAEVKGALRGAEQEAYRGLNGGRQKGEGRLDGGPAGGADGQLERLLGTARKGLDLAQGERNPVEESLDLLGSAEDLAKRRSPRAWARRARADRCLPFGEDSEHSGACGRQPSLHFYRRKTQDRRKSLVKASAGRSLTSSHVLIRRTSPVPSLGRAQ